MNIVTPSSTGLKHNLNTVWDAGNDGIGSGLDADLLDGKHASDFASSADLSGKVDKENILAKDVDLDTITTSGFYRITSSYNNGPSAVHHGQMIVTHGGYDTISQLVMPYSYARIYYRSGNTVNNSKGKWTD